MGSCLKPPKAPPFILNSHFHQVFLFIQNKEVKTKWHFNRTARKAPARNYQHFPLSLWKQQHGPSEHRHCSLPGSHWVSFDRHGERSDFDEEMFPLCASVQRRLDTHVRCPSVSMHRLMHMSFQTWSCHEWCPSVYLHFLMISSQWEIALIKITALTSQVRSDFYISWWWKICWDKL